MKQNNFSLADLLAALTALAIGFISFLGTNFLNIGKEEVWGLTYTAGCILQALVISILLFGTIYGAKRLKRINHSFKTAFILEALLLFLFTLFAVNLVIKNSPFLHYFTVTKQRSEILDKIHANINQAEKLFEAYEYYAENRQLLYENKLIAVAEAQRTNPTEYKKYGFDSRSGVSNASQIDTKMFTVHADLFPANYSDTVANSGIKEVAIGWLQHAKSTISSWKPIGIVSIVEDIEKNSNDWLSILISLSQVREQGEQATNFEYTFTFDDLKIHFTKLKRPMPLPIGLAVFAYILMLLSWFVTKRSTRWPGFKRLFGIGYSSENEL